MLFNSYVFLFCFLPLTLLAYQLAGMVGRRAVIVTLGGASLIFYAYWKPAFLFVLCGSILFNYLFASLICRRIPNSISTTALLWTAIIGNLTALGYFKYLFPLLNFLSASFGSGHHFADVLLPLGISFFTFTQIGYLVDLQQGGAIQQDFFSYLLFVTFFPHLIAGPILHHKDTMPQFQQNRVYRLQWNDVAVGLTWFTMGVCKKVLLADKLLPVASQTFSVHGMLTVQSAWLGVLSYTLQLYFDFSGYCDMACGLARMFSIDFPLNFSSPYKARNIIDFWQRWHITLTQYIGSYLYSPIQFWISRRRQEQGKKVSKKAQATPEGFLQMIALPTIFTMAIAGVWHGAGIQYFVFGLVHGAYLTVAHAWRLAKHRYGIASLTGIRGTLAHGASVLLTMVCVVFAQIFFRANSAHEAMLLIRRMIGMHVPDANPLVQISLRSSGRNLLIGFFIVWVLPNTQQILARYKPSLRLTPFDEQPRTAPVYWEPSLAWGLVLSVAMMCAVVGMQNPSTFLYFQF
jgi:D-alanyl-lipoteichoic acid acyltransferase DltB (MBOAT superfamily)